MNERITLYDPELAKSITKEGQRIVRELSHELEDKISMNERIKELAEQADAYARSEYEKWIPTPDFSGIPNIRKIFNVKFAELIVRECAKIGSKAMYPDSDPDYVGRKIKQHFGVKE